MVKGSLGSRMAAHRQGAATGLSAPGFGRRHNRRRPRRRARHKVDAMLYWLVDLSDKLSVLNVVRYITFRTGGAIYHRAVVRVLCSARP